MLQASRLDPGGSWAARRAKAESHPRTTRSQASKGFCLSLGREARGAAEHRGDAAGVQSARANAGKLNTQGHTGCGGHRARDDGGDVRSTRAVGAQMQVGRDARRSYTRARTLSQPVALQAAAVADSTEAGCDSCGHVTIEAKEAA